MGAVTFSILGSILVVFVFQWYDPKYQDALVAALQVQLLGLAIFVGVAALVFGASLAMRVSEAQNLARSSRLARYSGAIYPLGALLLGQLLGAVDPESLVNPVVGWAYMLIYPLAAALLLRAPTFRHREPKRSSNSP
jgi:hypothetical protein